MCSEFMHTATSEFEDIEDLTADSLSGEENGSIIVDESGRELYEHFRLVADKGQQL